MKITKELLRRYGLGICTEEEKKAVEKWLDTPEYPPMRISTAEKPKANSDEIWSQLAKGRPQLEEPMSLMKARNIVLFKNVTKYAAAACILFATFFGGRFSVGTANANTVADKKLKEDHLHIFGGNGTQGNLPGENFDVGFDGTVRLYNSSLSSKSIQVGDTSFLLESYQTYYLIGSADAPNLINKREIKNKHKKEKELLGDFSLLNLDR